MKSDRLGIVFVHIPKCGGTSVEQMLFEPEEQTEANFWMGGREFRNPKPGKFWELVENVGSRMVRAASGLKPTWNKYQTGGLQHLTALQIRHVLGKKKFEKFYRFSVVRNPVRRSVSQFNYMKQRPDLRAWIGMQPEDDFREYLCKTYSRHHVQWQGQVSFVYDHFGNRLVDKVVKLENLENGMNEVLDDLDLSPRNVPHLQRSTSASPVTITEDAKDIIWEIYQDDFVAFDYNMDDV